MRHAIYALSVAVVLAAMTCLMMGCAGNSTGIITQLDQTISSATDTVWQQKDCRAGLLASQVDVRNVSLETKTSINNLVKLADQNSEDFKKCYYFGSVFNTSY